MAVRDETGDIDAGVTTFGANFGDATRLIMTLRFIVDGDFDSLRFLVFDDDLSRRAKIVESAGFLAIVGKSPRVVEVSRDRLCD